MRPTDLGEVLAIERRSFPSAWSRESYLRELRNRNSCYFVARLGEQLIGYIGMWIVEEEAHITTLAVHPGRRRCGLAQRLLHHLCAVALKHGAAKLTLEVRAPNRAAQELYRKCGFQEKGLLPRYYGDTGEDGILMAKALLTGGRAAPE
jgi:ribosomal-protein-alanine N-acetyltransferase